MLITEMILVALQSVRANLFRAFLTMLGIIIGVASVITMIAIGSGARAAVDEQIDALGASVLSVRAGSFMQMGVARSAATLTIDDATAIARDTPSVRAVVPEIGGQQQIKNGNRNENLRVVGVSANFAEVLGHEPAAGRLFSNADDASRRTVAVLGSGVPAKLGSSSGAIVGQTVYIKGLAFEVVGVLAEKGASVKSCGNDQADDEIAVHDVGGLFTGTAPDSFDRDLADPRLADFVEDEDGGAVLGAIVGGHQDTGIRRMLGSVVLKPWSDLGRLDQFPVPVHRAGVGDLDGDAFGVVIVLLHRAGLREDDVQRLNLIQREGEKDEGGEQEEDNVDERDDLDACLLFAAFQKGCGSACHDKVGSE